MKCSKCLLDKDICDFRICKNRKSGYQMYCIICDKEYQKNWYKKNKEKVIKKSKIRNKEINSELNKFILDYLKVNPCIKCGETDPIVLEFDHIEIKTNSITDLIQKQKSINIIKNEIKQCQVLCANCHRRKTAKDFNWYRYINTVE